MRYILESDEGLESDLLFWCSRFIRYKLTTLSNTNVKDKNCILECLQRLNAGIQKIQDLEMICKNARNAGMIGINTYAQPILKLYEYLKKFHSMKDIDEEVLSDFLAVETSNLSLASKKNYRIALLGFFNFIDKQNQDIDGKSYIYNIELKNIAGTRGKSGQKLPTYLNEDELEKFLNGIECFEMSQKIRARNRLIIKMIVYTGMRVSEVLNLKAKDMVLENELYIINIKGKGDKYRVVMIKACHIQNLLKEWLMIRAKIDVLNELLFCNQKGGALTQAYIYNNVEKILSSVGICKQKMGAHMLRHSFATLLYQKRHDLVLVQEALGHADLNTSRIYTHFDKKRLLEAASIMDNINQTSNLIK